MLAAGGMQAGTFNYAVGDVLICFRRANPSTYVDLGGTNLVVDAGPISYFTNLAPNTKVTISTYTGSQLSQVGTNSVGWSAFAYFDHTAVSPAVPETIFITSPRDVLTTQTSPNHCATASANTLTIGQLGAIVAGAVDNPNTGSAALELSAYYYNSGDFSYSQGVGSSEDFNGTFTYNFEKYTPANFVTAGDPVRADFYWMYPVKLHAIASANYLGYFELGTNGVMTYTAYPTATVAVPVITSIRTHQWRILCQFHHRQHRHLYAARDEQFRLEYRADQLARHHVRDWQRFGQHLAGHHPGGQQVLRHHRPVNPFSIPNHHPQLK
jgi:hypothetical protein